MDRRQFISSALGASLVSAVCIPLAQAQSVFADGFETNTDTFAVSGFGNKSSTSYFEDFETQAIGPSISPVGRIHLSNSAAQTISSARAFSGARSMQNTYSLNDFPKNYLVLSGTRRRFYFSCHMYYSGSLTGAGVWKQGRIGAESIYSGTPRAGESWTSGNALPDGFAGEIVNSDGITSYWAQNTAAPGAESIYDLNRWMFYEFEFDAGTLNAADSLTRASVDAVPVLVWNQRPYLTSASPKLPEWFLTPINGLDGSPAITVNMDSVYADESRARVIFTNEPSYSASTLFNLQPIISYADTQLITRRLIPSFAIGQTVHVHAWTELGAYRYLGTHLLRAG